MDGTAQTTPLGALAGYIHSQQSPAQGVTNFILYEQLRDGNGLLNPQRRDCSPEWFFWSAPIGASW
jgi:hypothetical protein